VEKARELKHKPVEAEALTVQGVLLDRTAESARGAEVLRQAALAADAGRSDRVRARAAIEAVFALALAHDYARAEEWAAEEMKRLGLSNVRREPFTMGASWERGTAAASLVSDAGARLLGVASYTWTPGTEGAVEGELVDVGAGRPEDVARVASRVKGRIALVVPEGADLPAVIYNFYRAPGLVRELKEAGALAVLIAADKPHTMLYTAPVDFNAGGRLAALPTLSLAREDTALLRRLVAQGQTPRLRLDVRNKVGPAFEATNVVGELAGTELARELVVVGAHLDSNDLGPGALDNAAGCAAVLEAARAFKALGLKPRRTLRFVLWTGEEEGMVGSVAYVERHRAELDATVAPLRQEPAGN
jgi:hypothetical protein